MSLSDREEITLARALLELSGQVALARADANKNVLGGIEHGQANTRMAIAAARMEAAASSLQAWTANTTTALRAHHALQTQGLMEVIAERNAKPLEDDSVHVSLPLGGKQLSVTANKVHVERLARWAVVVLTAASAWLAGQAVGADHAAQRVIEQVRR